MAETFVLIRPGEPNTDREFSIGMGYIAGALQNAGLRVETLCLDLHPMEDIAFARYLCENPEYRYFGIGGMYGSFPEFIRLSRLIRELRPEAKIILGGALPTSCPEFALQKTGADFACIGPAEDTTVELMQALIGGGDLDQVSGLCISEGGTQRRTGLRTHYKKRIPVCGQASWPAWELFPAEDYLHATPYYPFRANDRIAPILTARGCPYSCNFCFQPSAYATRELDDVFDEMEWLIERYRITGFYIEDDLFMLDKKRLLAFCEGLLRRGIRTRYTCTGRFNIVNPALLEALRESGCVTLFYGGESADQETLDLMKKVTSVEQMKAGVAMTREAGIFSRIGFMFGQPGETRQTLEKTVDFLRSITYGEFEARYIYGTVPFPGTALFDHCVEKGLLRDNQDLLDRFEFKPRLLDQIPVNMTAIADTHPRQLLDEANAKLRRHYEEHRGVWMSSRLTSQRQVA